MIWTIFVILLLLWFLGVMSGVGGWFIHLLLIVAGAVLIFSLIRNRQQAF
ncbi:MAG TPA: lmo0937 family membrane protein [Blastocatellia bacterium]|nr:lmo0937 family membrane protein [Blastocatellia bacterium]